jgi:hypothetical protein
MAEYGSSGVWAIGTHGPGLFRHAMVETASLGLPTALAAGLAAWIDRYERENLTGNLDTDSFNTEGEALARALKAHVGPDIHVEFQPELPDGGLGNAIPIA